MDCDRAREAVSARIDGEGSGVPDIALAAHLSGCADCRAWEQRAHVVTRHARLGVAFLDHDLSPRVLAAVPPPATQARTVTRRAALAAVAALQVAITVPLLVFGHDRDAGVHAAHELGSFDLALAIAFCVGAVRPALSAGLAWPCGIAAGGLVGTAVIDMIGGQTFGLDEAQHLVALVGALLLVWQARTVAAGTAGPQAAGSRQSALHRALHPALHPAAPPRNDGTDAACTGDAIASAGTNRSAGARDAVA
jgi:predicted anti-sigma-YlaC factor YlaD